ncbi:Fic family protein [Pseudoruegeria sp. SK021]|uniref:Fic family protein n=1 Tax=Pseudoruegeria sp. SK021 TaxID=1933035 RepID=UPI000A243BAD|nr:Fic family protein [Pseudoruegeria sp. SK021]OSP53722.1 filamentation induced by cAMP protein fic [Pseudoruegeria sp. SK021]
MLETPGRIEPCFFEDQIPATLADLSVEIQREATRLGQGLHPDSAAELADFVRVMNCYYSNLIEGHNTRPRDIERALAGAELEEETRPLALEARAHVIVQRAIDERHRAGSLPRPTSVEFLTWVHKAFYDEMPDEFRVVEFADGTREPIIPGHMRQGGDREVAVGRHLPPSSPRVAAFMDHFDRRFQIAARSASGRIIAIASAHHRLNYIHPFPDGNGRVSRLMSHAMAFTAGIGGEGLWSVSRGLARGLTDRGDYKRMMDLADSARRGDRDGRGNLSEAALKTYCEWFLTVALDQITFSAKLFDLGGLDKRYRRLVEDTIDDKRAPDLMSAVLRHGKLDRGEAHIVLKTSERTARNTLKQLTSAGYLISPSPKTPVRLAFPLDYRERLFPNLFTDADLPA